MISGGVWGQRCDQIDEVQLFSHWLRGRFKSISLSFQRTRDLKPFKLKEIFYTEDRKNTGKQRFGSE